MNISEQRPSSPAPRPDSADRSPMTVVYALEEPPVSWSKALFAAGPTPRSPGVPSWRPQLLELLEAAGYDGVVFVPEDRTGTFHGDYDGQIEWEERCLHLADVVLFWVPRDLSIMPALTTNVEWGTWAASGKVVFGAPPEAERNTYLWRYADQYQVPSATTLPGTVEAALAMLGDGAWRTGGERHVPLMVWRTPSFQSWYAAQTQAGNTLRAARVLWTLRAGPAGAVFLWACHVEVWVAAEGRAKTNEVVLARTDVAAVVLYQRAVTLEESQVVLVREFRSPAATVDGFVRECPGGSAWAAEPAACTHQAGTDEREQMRSNRRCHHADPCPGPAVGMAAVAIEEVEQECGLRLDPTRLRPLRVRQLAATLSAHRGHVYAVELTDAEMARLHAAAAAGAVFGEVDSSERTHVEVHTVAQLRAQELVDWSTLGMVLDALT